MSKMQCIGIEKKVHAFSLKPISFQMESGYLTGLIGVNGAGKSTLIRILAGMEPEYEGEVMVDGMTLKDNYETVKQKIAVVSEDISFFKDKNALENGELLGCYFEKFSMEEYYRWLDRLKLPKGQPIFQFSKGMYMKFQLAFAMSHEPEFLLLDEPTSGFDPVFRKDFMRILQEIRDRKIGILMSTHIISDIENIADYVILIDGGEMKLNDTKEAFGNRTIQQMLEKYSVKRTRIGDLLKRKTVSDYDAS